MKKIIYLLLFTFVLTGCSAVYEVNILEDEILENLYLREDNSVLSKYGSDLNSTLNSMVDYYFSVDSSIEPQILISNKKDITSIYDNYASITLSKNYVDLNNYSKSLFGTYFFDTFVISKDGDNTVIYANKLKYDEIFRIVSEYKYKFDFDTLNIKMVIPYKVVNNNADIVDGNTYTWVFNKNNYNKEVKVVYDTDYTIYKNNTSNSNVLDKISGKIIDTVTFGTVDGEAVSKGNGVIIVIGIILMLLVLAFVIFTKISKSRDEI